MLDTYNYEIKLVKKPLSDSDEVILYWELRIDNSSFYFKDFNNAEKFARDYKKENDSL